MAYTTALGRSYRRMQTMKPKDRKKKPTCPKCGSPLRIVEADPRGRPWCEKPGCGYVGAATKTPPPAKWGPREDAHLVAVKKWLADEWRDDTEIEAMLAPDSYAAAARAFGQSSLAWEEGRAILKAELKARRERDKGRPVERAGDKCEAKPDAMLTIRQAAEYARVDERTIRDWLDRCDGDKRMLPGAIKVGRKVCIPQTDLNPWRKAAKATRTPKKTSRKRPARKPVKRKS